MRKADSGPKKAHVIHDLSYRSHGRAGIVAALLLVNADGRGEAFDAIAIGLLNLSEELPRLGAQTLDVAALPLGVQGVEG